MPRQYETPPAGMLHCSACKEFHEIEAFAHNPHQPHRAGGREHICKEATNVNRRIKVLKTKTADQLLAETQDRATRLKECIAVLKEDHGIDLND